MSRSQESPSLKRKRPEPNTHAQTPESVLLNLIKSKGDMGIWKGDMKRETSLPEPVVNKAIKTLQGKALIKEVVNIKSKGRKHFMAAEFEPSKELTGGAWYVEGKLDQEFIAVLKDSCSKIIRKLKVVTAEGISDFIKRNKITTIECKTHQIEEILKSMVLDNEIFEVKSTGLGEYHSIPIGTACYRSSTGMGLGQGPKIGAMASIPCGVCPRISQCTPDGIISPKTCIWESETRMDILLRSVIRDKIIRFADRLGVLQEYLRDHWTIFLILCLASTRLGTTTSLKSNVMNYGAVGDGKTDDSQAFLKAWKAICQAKSVVPILVIPTMTFLLKPATFSGPCKSSNIYVQVLVNLVAPNTKWAWIGHHIDMWLAFSNVNGLSIIGQQGRIDSQGSAWRPLPCLQQNVQNVTREIMTVKNCNGVFISNLYVIAPETSPNTDGIDISGSTNIQIGNSNIKTGDDCIAISRGSSNVNITGVTCRPGNGIRMEGIHGGNGYARKISFENITLVQVNNPILIDQFYCPSRVDCQNKLSYSGIMGTSTADEVINLSCSQSGSSGCTDISLDCVYIASTIPGKKTYANCFNAHGRSTHTKPTVKCLLQ
ncbi:unnamed protein product [Camellia sinensis]